MYSKMFNERMLDWIKGIVMKGKTEGWWGHDGGFYGKQFEDSFAQFNNSKHGILTSNGSSSIYVSLRACGVGRGDRVAVSTYTHIGSLAPILLAGARPVFVDIDKYGNINPEELRMESKLKAVVLAHQGGRPSQLDEILDIKDLIVVEDCSQTLGGKYNNKMVGNFGSVGCFSIGGDMTKTITIGEGGMIVTNNDELAEKCRNIRNHGDNYKGCKYLCFNFRVSDVQALIGLSQMERLPYLINWQKSHAKYLIANLPKFLKVNKPLGGTEPVYFVISCKFDERIAGISRDEFLNRLKDFNGNVPRKIISMGSSRLLHELPLYKRFAKGRKFLVAQERRRTTVQIDWHRYPRGYSEIDELLAKFNEVIK